MPEDKTPLPQGDESQPVVWTPEDASRFLTSAIHEAQRPLAEALKQRPITSKAMTVIVIVMAVAAAFIAIILSSQIEKAEKQTETVRNEWKEVYTERTELQTKSTILEDRLTNAQQALAGMRINEDELKRTRTDLQRSRRQNELLRSQISGLEMEKMALARQLEAVKAMAVESAGEEAIPDEEILQDNGEIIHPPVAATREEPGANASNAVPAGDPFPNNQLRPIVTPHPDSASPSAPIVDAAPAQAAPTDDQDVKIEASKPNADNPPTLYETSQIFTDPASSNVAKTADEMVIVTVTPSFVDADATSQTLDEAKAPDTAEPQKVTPDDDAAARQAAPEVNEEDAPEEPAVQDEAAVEPEESASSEEAADSNEGARPDGVPVL